VPEPAALGRLLLWAIEMSHSKAACLFFARKQSCPNGKSCPYSHDERVCLNLMSQVCARFFSKLNCLFVIIFSHCRSLPMHKCIRLRAHCITCYTPTESTVTVTSTAAVVPRIRPLILPPRARERTRIIPKSTAIVPPHMPPPPMHIRTRNT
jgi:hypothetical protein